MPERGESPASRGDAQAGRYAQPARLDGGLNGWISAGKPVRRGRERISLERQVRIAAGALAAAGGLLALKAHPRFGLLSALCRGRTRLRGRDRHLRDGQDAGEATYNQAGCDVEAMVEALKQGESPVQLEQGRS